jgi:hypothetical protein
MKPAKTTNMHDDIDYEKTWTDTERCNRIIAGMEARIEAIMERNQRMRVMLEELARHYGLEHAATDELPRPGRGETQ